eukprot:CAMPEP_0177488974 /NCGR_PEP_ID=MMETSP0369-20130122/30449_1 /TAXON_ID=447022 ORGANISM="Scrippsiella hangoei-like, Strain SHHI-4" /NCGR_SAMPLE_ID=MMETSP0369 /ASSEMBLY_ACC=CAM_ASM_000364 /LENGTH=65 /DNA_ID=CAMNT_0018965393 /DNA_START=142 /DNA_END=336 /DNA_ORIENTATION=-
MPDLLAAQEAVATEQCEDLRTLDKAEFLRRVILLDDANKSLLAKRCAQASLPGPQHLRVLHNGIG